MYNGIINFYKEKGFTSHDAVGALRRILHQKKIGHTGTLDPQAEGVLPICLGTGTKLAGMLTDTDKEYRAVLRLGVTTDTQDLTGTILQERPVRVVPEEIHAAAAGFTGTQMQTPPMYSAVKVDGRRLYELARQGKSVERVPRQITIYSIDVENISLPDVTLKIACSKGTYIRTLCEDLGNALGCGGAMAELTRTRAAGFSLQDSLPLSRVQELEDRGELEKYVISVEEVFRRLPCAVTLREADGKARNGNTLEVRELCFTRAQGIQGNRPGPGVSKETGKGSEKISPKAVGPEAAGVTKEGIRVRDSEGNFIGIYRLDHQRRLWMPDKIFYRYPDSKQ